MTKNETLTIEQLQQFELGFEAASSQSTATDIALMSVSDEATVTDSDSDRYRAFNLSLEELGGFWTPKP